MTVSTVEMTQHNTGVTWRHICITIIATLISALLGIYAVIVAPTGSSPGVSGLYLSAAIYVPLSLWLGMWGCLAGYFSQLIVGFMVTPFGPWNFLWALADFFEGLVVLLAFRCIKTDVDIGAELKRPNVLKIILAGLLVNLVIAAIATILNLLILLIITLIVAIGLSIVMYILNSSRSWAIYVTFGIFAASISSAIIGVGIPILSGIAPIEGFWPSTFGWFAGDLIILASISTILMVFFTRHIKKLSIFVKNWFS